MQTIAEILISFLIVAGAAFALIGSWGLVRLPSLMTRLHGPTKATTLGVGGCLIASMIYFPAFHGHWSAHELLITLFLFVTAPVTANMIAKAHMHRQGWGIDPNPADGIRDELPDTGGPKGWATFWEPRSRSDPRPRPEPPELGPKPGDG